jgi:outer membrane protein
MRGNRPLALLATLLAAWTPLPAQQPTIDRPTGTVLLRPFKAATIPPLQPANTDRLHKLIRGNSLYLTLQDAIALAIENNLDLQVDRYGPLTAEWELQRQEAGGPLKGVTNGSTFVSQVTPGQGIAGAEQSAGLSTGGGGGGGGSNSNSSISQYTAVVPNLDMVFQNSSAWSHSTSPQPNAAISQTPELVSSAHIFQSFVQQGFLSGGYVQVAQTEEYLNQNSPNYVINPSVAPVAQIYVRHNLLDGFGVALNSRFIRVAKAGIVRSQETFREQLLTLVANVVNLYWGLVSANDDLKARQHTRDTARKFLEDTRHEVELGEVAGFQITKAQAELSTRTQEAAIAETSVRQQELLLKDVMSRDGVKDPLLDTAVIVPLDSIRIPAEDDVPPLRNLVAKALEQRPDIAIAKINDETQQILAVGTRSEVKPLLLGIAATSNQGEAGVPNPHPPPGELPNPNAEGGLGTALGQIFKHDYSTYRGAIVFQAPFGNRVAQSDYEIDQLQIKQGDLVTRRNMNQLVVDISSATVAVRQSRARYAQAVSTRMLQEDLLEKEQQKFSLGSSTIDAIIAAERVLAASQYTEVATRSAYSRARVALDQVLGQTLEANNVSIDQALKGRIDRESVLP